MRLILLIIFSTRVLLIFGQYEFEIIHDLEPELVEKWSLDFIKEKNINNVSVKVKSFSYKIFKYRQKFDLLSYNSSANVIKYKDVVVFPALDKGGYPIFNSRDVTLNYDSSNKIISRFEQSSILTKVENHWKPESTIKVFYKHDNDRIIQEIKIKSEFRKTDTSYIIVERQSVYDYKYYQDSINVLYSFTPDIVVYGNPSNVNPKLLSSSSCDNKVYKRQYLNKNSQLELEIINQFGRIDTIRYKYNDSVLVCKESLNNESFNFTYNDSGKISSRCMKGNTGNYCSYFEYKFLDNTEFRKEVNGNDIASTEIEYNLDGLITKKTVRRNGKVIIKYKYTYN